MTPRGPVRRCVIDVAPCSPCTRRGCAPRPTDAVLPVTSTGRDEGHPADRALRPAAAGVAVAAPHARDLCAAHAGARGDADCRSAAVSTQPSGAHAEDAGDGVCSRCWW
jgi:hypothetical protein